MLTRDPGRPPSAPPAPGMGANGASGAAHQPPPRPPDAKPNGLLLTSPADPVANGGRDNEHSDLIMRVGDALVNERGVR